MPAFRLYSDTTNFGELSKKVMKKWAIWLTLMVIVVVRTEAQTEVEAADSSDVLQEVVIRAYETNRKLIEVPAAVSFINKAQLNRFSNISLVPALNTAPGVRMEERSPGSYRLNIRGST